MKISLLRNLCLSFLGVALGIACGSLATRKGFYQPIAVEVSKGDYARALTLFDAAKAGGKFDEKDRFLYFMDAGLLSHYADSTFLSNTKLTLAEQASDELFAKSISRAAVSMILNDNVLEYAGEDYEVLYTNLFKALNYIQVDSFEAAFVEIRRANQKLELLGQKYADAASRLQEGYDQDSSHVPMKFAAKDVRFNNDAFARYLSMHMYAADGKFDDARIDSSALVDAFASQPNLYPFAAPEVRYMPQESHSSILSVVGLAGLSPEKEDMNLRIRTDKQLKLLSVLYTEPTGKQTVLENLPMDIGEDFYFKLSVPTIVSRPSRVAGIRVLADGRELGDLSLLEDIGIIARETFEAHKSLVYVRSIARAVIKGLAAHKAKKKVDTGGLGGWLKKAAIDAATDVSENADLRCVRFLPGQVYVRDFDLAPGPHDITIQFLDQTGAMLSQKTITGYQVLANGLNLVQAACLN